MKKVFGLVLAGIMMLSTPLIAFADIIDELEFSIASEYLTPEGMHKALAMEPSLIHQLRRLYPDEWAAYQEWLAIGGPSGGNLDPVAVAEAEAAAVEAVLQEQYARESEANAIAAEAIGLSMATQNEAAELNKSIGEYFNNSVNSVPGLDYAIPVAQGGNVIINGEPSNQTFSVYKPLLAHVDAAKAQAASLGGAVMNVVDIDASVCFEVATVNFYMPGITGAENVQVYHFSNGVWTQVNVAEVRTDHVVVDMTAPGILAFILMPA